jgi:hypothetical protein
MAALRNKSAHVPYRNSTLTHLLTSSLSGQSKVLMFACTSGDPADATESIGTLQFASRVRNVQLGVAKAKKSRTQNAALIAKLAKVEAALAESNINTERLTAELKVAREESASTRGSVAFQLIEGQAKLAERTKQLEAEFALKNRMFAIPVLPPSVNESAAPSTMEIENLKLQAQLTALKREVLELKMQRNNPTVTVLAPLAADITGAAAAVTSVRSPVPARTLPQIHAFVSPGAIARSAQLGVNLLDGATVDTTIATTSEVISIPFVLHDECMMDNATDVDVTEEITAPIASAVAKKRDSLTGRKRKDSPLKNAEESPTAEDEPETQTGVDENIPAVALTAVAPPKSVLSKKARITAPLAPQPSTPGRTALSHTTAALNAAKTTTAARAVASTGVKSISSLFGNGGMPAIKPRSTTSATVTRSKWNSSSKALAAPTTPIRSTVAAMAAAANAASLDDSISDPNLTPIPSNSGGKSVRFGAAMTKFISPDATPIAPSNPQTNGLNSNIGSIPLPTAITTPAHIESLRVKSRTSKPQVPVYFNTARILSSNAAASAGTSAGFINTLGSARRQPVKPATGWIR